MVDLLNYNLNEVVEPACRMVARGEVSVIEVVPALPLDDDRLRRLEAFATARGVCLSIDDAGAIVLRGGVRSAPSAPTFKWRRWLRWSPALCLPFGAFPFAGAAR